MRSPFFFTAIVHHLAARARKCCAISSAMEQWRRSHISILVDSSAMTRKFIETKRDENGFKFLTPAPVRQLSDELELDLWMDGPYVRGNGSREDARKLLTSIQDKVRTCWWELVCFCSEPATPTAAWWV